jgi:collagenase-like PrtC family protease
MKINAAFSNLKEAEYLASHADEIYCGLLTSPDEEGMTNHRPNLPSMNLDGLDELKEAANIAHNNSIKLSLVVNEVGYSDLFLKKILDKIMKAKSLGADAFVVADIGLLKILQDKGIEAILSSVAPAFNSYAVDFYKQFGIKRIMLSQHLYPAELAKMMPLGIETEVFFFKINYCRCIDGHCFYTYNNQIWNKKIPMDACDHISKMVKYKDGNSRTSILSFFRYNFPAGLDAFGAVYDFANMGVDFLKLGNREHSFSKKRRILRFAKYMVKQLDKGIERREFVRKCRMRWM